MKHINSLSDLIGCKIIRHDGIAEIIIDTYIDDGTHIEDWGKPVRLIGFSADASLTDYEIYEEGWEYYSAFKEEISKLKNKNS